MFQAVRRHLAVFLAAVLGVVVGSVGPGVARAAYDAVNADKVDGKHAVGASATANQRAGKLVAANAQGRIPDAERLGGYTHRQLRSQPLPVHAAHVDIPAEMTATGIEMPSIGSPRLVIDFVIPPDHKPNTPLFLDLVFGESNVSACSWWAYTGGLFGPTDSDGGFYNAGWEVLPVDDNEGPVAAPVGSDGHTQTFRFRFDNQPGQVVQFDLTRDPEDPADTCSGITIYGMQLRY